MITLHLRAFKTFIIPAFTVFLLSCSASKQTFNPDRRYPSKKLKEDYRVFRNVLEESHPSLYWFTPKDTIDYFFDLGSKEIRDSMTEREFRTVLTYVISKIRCGHTSIKYSKKYSKYLDTARLKLFPLTFKFWKDTMVVVGNLNRKDSMLKRGTLIKSVNGYTNIQLVDTFFQYLPGDGYAENGKYQTLSNRGNFGAIFKNVFGLPEKIPVDFIDTAGLSKEREVSVFQPEKDTTERDILRLPATERRFRRQRTLNVARNVQIDTSLSSAYMTVNTFSGGNRLRGFFRRAFKTIDKLKIHHLVVDVRGNGGGDATLSSLLTRYLIDKKFKIADSLYAISRSSHYGRYIKWNSVYWIMMKFVTRKHSDGKYHFGFFERHYFKPKKRYHFDSNVYVIIGGNSFSATTLFAKSLKGQHNITLIGEETGGGAYGNTAWMIPDVTLPNTRIRFRLPKFRLVMDKELVKEGRGVMPDIEVYPTVESIKKGVDLKVEKIKQLIREKNLPPRQ